MAQCRSMEDTELLADTKDNTELLFPTKDISWVTSHQNSAYLFFPPPRTINADINTAWKTVKEVDRYQQFSQGSVTATNVNLNPGSAISFDIQVNNCCGGYKLHSDEVISIVDERNKVLGWERKLPFTDEPTERYHILEQSPENKNMTISRIALRVPRGFIGFFTDKIYRNDIEQAFDELHAGIKDAAECTNKMNS